MTGQEGGLAPALSSAHSLPRFHKPSSDFCKFISFPFQLVVIRLGPDKYWITKKHPSPGKRRRDLQFVPGIQGTETAGLDREWDDRVSTSAWRAVRGRV